MGPFALDELNAYTSDRCLRRYQRLILENRPFLLAIDERIFSFVRSEALTYANLLFFKSDDSYFYTVADGASNGYEIPKALHSVTGKQHNFVQRPFSRDETCITIGHSNFAHVLWNHLSAFHLVTSSGHHAYCQTKDFLGDIADILRISGESVAANDLRQFKNTLLVGGEYLNHETHAALIRFLEEKMSSFPLPPEREDKTIIYLGVRGAVVRELENEVEFYSHLIKTFMAHEPRAFFYLDGFSFTNSNSTCEKALLRSHQAHSRIMEIVHGLAADRYRIINGLPLIEALSYIRHAEFYITHEGTMQHKVGWFFPQKRGAIVTGSSFQDSTAEWHSNQVAGAVQPYHLKESHVVPFKDGNRDSSFAIRDIPGSSELLVESFFGSSRNRVSGSEC
jgi:hypothetical protein